MKIYYITRPSTKPPTFVAFVNKSELFHFLIKGILKIRFGKLSDWKEHRFGLLCASEMKSSLKMQIIFPVLTVNAVRTNHLFLICSADIT